MPAEPMEEDTYWGCQMESQLSIHLNYTYKNGGAEKAKGGSSAKSLVGKLAVAKIQSQLWFVACRKFPCDLEKLF